MRVVHHLPSQVPLAVPAPGENGRRIAPEVPTVADDAARKGVAVVHVALGGVAGGDEEGVEADDFFPAGEKTIWPAG